MVFGIIAAVAAAPAIVGTTEAIRSGQRQNAREAHRGRKSNLTITLPKKNSYSAQFDNALIVLKDNKLYIDTAKPSQLLGTCHPFSGYFLPYPDKGDEWKRAGFRNAEGMVTTISEDPPFLNWVFVDRDTHEVKYGVRADAQPHHVGPWDCTPIDRRLTFEGWEGFVIVQEDEQADLWALYFDRHDDGLSGQGMVGTQDRRMLEVNVSRKEKKRTKLTSDEERIDQIRADKEKKLAQQELQVTPDVHVEQNPSEELNEPSNSTVVAQEEQNEIAVNTQDTKQEDQQLPIGKVAEEEERDQHRQKRPATSVTQNKDENTLKGLSNFLNRVRRNSYTREKRTRQITPEGR
jgi:major membrane immunogen (membrane-anchored lipoprotein)